MMEKGLTILFVCLSATSIAVALKCYQCDSLTDGKGCIDGDNSKWDVTDKCYQNKKNVFFLSTNEVPEDLKHSEDTVEFCLQLYTADRSIFIRKCDFAKLDGDPCDFHRKKYHVQDCMSCRKDLCNDVPGKPQESVPL